MKEQILAAVAAAVVILVIAIDHTHAAGYEFRLTDKQRHVVMVLHFSTFDDCREARRVAEYFDHYGTCNGEN